MSVLPKASELNAAADEQMRPRFPYDREAMTRRVMVVTASGAEVEVERPVARHIDEANQLRKDYWHPGGEIYDSQGRRWGFRAQPGWLLYGYKWQDDPPHVRPLVDN